MIRNRFRIAFGIVSISMMGLLVGCASSGSTQSTAPASVATPVATELPAPGKPILIFDADTSQAYEILGEIVAELKDQRVYNYEGAKDQVREHLKRLAYSKYGDRLDAIVNFRTVTSVGGGGFWGAVGAAYGARNTDIQASGIAIRCKSSRVVAEPRPAASPGSAVADSSPPVKSSPQSVAPTEETESMSVLEAQKKLIDLKYLSGRPDGVLGNKTVSALKSFQRDNGIPATGVIDKATVTRLRSAEKRQ